MTLLVFDPLEREIPLTGKVVASDGRSQLELDTTARGFLEQYRQEFEGQLEKLTQISRKQEIPLIPLSTARPVAEQVRERLCYHPRVARQ